MKKIIMWVSLSVFLCSSSCEQFNPPADTSADATNVQVVQGGQTNGEEENNDDDNGEDDDDN